MLPLGGPEEPLWVHASPERRHEPGACQGLFRSHLRAVVPNEPRKEEGAAAAFGLGAMRSAQRQPAPGRWQWSGRPPGRSGSGAVAITARLSQLAPRARGAPAAALDINQGLCLPPRRARVACWRWPALGCEKPPPKPRCAPLGLAHWHHPPSRVPRCRSSRPVHGASPARAISRALLLRARLAPVRRPTRRRARGYARSRAQALTFTWPCMRTPTARPRGRALARARLAQFCAPSGSPSARATPGGSALSCPWLRGRPCVAAVAAAFQDRRDSSSMAPGPSPPWVARG